MSYEHDYTLVNPVSITKLDDAGRPIESIRATRASTEVKLSASDSFPQSSCVRCSTTQYNDQGQVESTRVYHTIPESGGGLAVPSVRSGVPPIRAVRPTVRRPMLVVRTPAALPKVACFGLSVRGQSARVSPRLWAGFKTGCGDPWMPNPRADAADARPQRWPWFELPATGSSSAGSATV